MKTAGLKVVYCAVAFFFAFDIVVGLLVHQIGLK